LAGKREIAVGEEKKDEILRENSAYCGTGQKSSCQKETKRGKVKGADLVEYEGWSGKRPGGSRRKACSRPLLARGAYKVNEWAKEKKRKSPTDNGSEYRGIAQKAT